MKTKTFFALSLIVNAVLLTVVAYLTFSDVELRNDPIIIINRWVSSESPKSASTVEPNVASLPN